MKLILPVFLFAAIITLNSCSSANKTAQTPEDVYYSPGQQSSSYSNRSNNNNAQSDYYNANPNDQYLMMKVQSDPTSSRWSTFDDYGYDGYYNSAASMGYGYGYGYGGYYNGFSPWMCFGFGFGNPYYFYNSYYGWNAFYNPYFYYGNIAYVGGKSSPYSTYVGTNSFNPAAYRKGVFSNINSRYVSRNNSFSNRNGNSFASPSNSRSTYYNQNNNRSFAQPTRTYSPPSSFGNGGGSRSGGGGGFSRSGRP